MILQRVDGVEQELASHVTWEYTISGIHPETHMFVKTSDQRLLTVPHINLTVGAFSLQIVLKIYFKIAVDCVTTKITYYLTLCKISLYVHIFENVGHTCFSVCDLCSLIHLYWSYDASVKWSCVNSTVYFRMFIIARRSVWTVVGWSRRFALYRRLGHHQSESI